jgi:putative GTP pyrophosphokinase
VASRHNLHTPEEMLRDFWRAAEADGGFDFGTDK